MEFTGVFYMSRSTRSMTQDDLDALLLDARSHNASVGITGVLLHGDGRFFQYFEGKPFAVANVYARIRSSTLHTDLVELDNCQMMQRLFCDWFMGFREMPVGTLQKLSQDQWDRERLSVEGLASLPPRLQQLFAFF